MRTDILSECTGVEWDLHNSEKIGTRHGVAPTECEQLFFNLPLMVEEDMKHSQMENRFFSLGKTDGGRLLFVVFTIRGNKIRVISARDMNRKEKGTYQTHEEENTEI